MVADIIAQFIDVPMLLGVVRCLGFIGRRGRKGLLEYTKVEGVLFCNLLLLALRTHNYNYTTVIASLVLDHAIKGKHICLHSLGKYHVTGFSAKQVTGCKLAICIVC